MKGKMKKLLLILLFINVHFFAISQEEVKAVKLKSAGEIINVSTYSFPVFYDFDKDGLKDLIIGEFRGSLRFYKNIGTAENPKFNGFTKLQAEGEDIVVPNY